MLKIKNLKSVLTFGFFTVSDIDSLSIFVMKFWIFMKIMIVLRHFRKFQQTYKSPYAKIYAKIEAKH